MVRERLARRRAGEAHVHVGVLVREFSVCEEAHVLRSARDRVVRERLARGRAGEAHVEKDVA